MTKLKVLFVCIHNSARSQMAEALLNHLCGNQFEAESAGLEPGKLNPLAVEAMRLMDVDISQAQAKSVFEKFKNAEHFAYVVTVCDETSGERCPIFPGAAKRIHWGFPDPSSFTGSWEERVQHTVEVRDMIAAQIREWCPTVCPELDCCETAS
ncbi:MAG: arsenate reductase ArsC [Chthoniobacter sp.]